MYLPLGTPSCLPFYSYIHMSHLPMCPPSLVSFSISHVQSPSLPAHPFSVSTEQCVQFGILFPLLPGMPPLCPYPHALPECLWAGGIIGKEVERKWQGASLEVLDLGIYPTSGFGDASPDPMQASLQSSILLSCK